MLDYINEDQFQNFAHYKINFHLGFNYTENILKKNAIVYCHTNYIPFLFDQLKKTNKKYILITHGSDHFIDYEKFSTKSNNIIKWFAENKDYENEDLIAIPIGLNPQHNENYLKKIAFIDKYNEELKKLPKRSDLLYCNWETGNGNKRDGALFNSFRMPCLWESRLPINEYYSHMAQFKYVVSPPGNGIDCHRTWEALYLGCIPIVIKHFLYDDFEGLPILQVNDYSEVNKELLEEFSQREFNYKKLYMSYWKNRITEEFDKL